MSSLATFTKRESKTKLLSKYLFIASFLFFVVSSGFLVLIYFPVVKEEIRYEFFPKTALQEITPADKNFGLIIPKIKANAKVLKNIDPYSSQIYQQALAQGVAHAQGSSLPGERGAVFLFAHSSGNFYQANRYNSIFYLLHKLAKGDKIYLYYLGSRYEYEVQALLTVEETAVSYLRKAEESTETLILMTCWPPGTTFKRLLVRAIRVY